VHRSRLGCGESHRFARRDRSRCQTAREPRRHDAQCRRVTSAQQGGRARGTGEVKARKRTQAARRLRAIAASPRARTIGCHR
jgi:hypothetical protein